MEIRGHIANGVVVLDDGVFLPEGTAVIVIAAEPPESGKSAEGKRVEFPLIRSEHPGTLDLNNERIAEILMEEEVEAYLALQASLAPKKD